ncbi:hypothetical protein [Thermomonospora catenispora]|uniref:hypothetical protein n=1 Tax=Thermomonospora catenispora TaxID=2493090 RepID=UPI001123C179|nr:hypothetical protein [Thermomonospora catenispora]TNY36838.1 hypothetical protein EIO00_11045 [Thermomonospora catenispora]
MRRSVAIAALSAGVAVGIARRLMDRAAGRTPAGEEPERWLAVTVDRPPQEVSDRLPGLLGGLRGPLEVRIDGILGGRGTELAIRPGGPAGAEGRAGRDSRAELWRALRDAKARLEADRPPRPDPPSADSVSGDAAERTARRDEGT